jgi:hypothetical protein
LHSIGANEEVDVYSTLPPQPSVAPHPLGTGRRRVDRFGKIDHRFVSRLLSGGYRFPFPLT